MTSQLDSSQILREAWDDTLGGLKTVPASATTFSVELSHADGDSVLTVGNAQQASANITSASTGVIIAEFDCTGYKSFNLFSKTTSTIVGAQTVTLEISPAASGDVWFATTLTLTPSTVNNTVLMGTLSSFIAKRARASIASTITSGTATIYLLTQTN